MLLCFGISNYLLGSRKNLIHTYITKFQGPEVVTNFIIYLIHYAKKITECMKFVYL